MAAGFSPPAASLTCRTPDSTPLHVASSKPTDRIHFIPAVGSQPFAAVKLRTFASPSSTTIACSARDYLLKRFSSLSLCGSSQPTDQTPFISTVVSPVKGFPVVIESRHVTMLSISACLTAISASWLFFSAIPTILALRRAAESLEKLLDTAREELPDTMAAVRLSGMEISDLTVELSDLGQEITRGVRNSTRAVRMAEDKLRHLTKQTPTVPFQGQVDRGNDRDAPAVAKTARNFREGVVKGRALLGTVLSVMQFARWAWNYLTLYRRKQQL